MSAHPVLGHLYGKAEPAEHHLDRLHRMHAPFVLSWNPVRGVWVLYERSGDPVWRDAGLARRERYLATAQGQQALDPGLWEAIQQQIDGLHWWGEWPEGGVFSDAWFNEVAKGLREEQDASWQAIVASDQREREARDIWDEAHNNEAYLERLKASMPDLAKSIEEMSRETYAKVCRGAISAGYAGIH